MAKQKRDWTSNKKQHGVNWKHRDQGPKGTGRAPIEPARRGQKRKVETDQPPPEPLTHRLGEQLSSLMTDDEKAAAIGNRR